MTTDASLIGWGCCLDTVTTGGNWTPEEAQHDINYLEILAVFLALKSFSNTVSGKHIKLMVDNTTAVSTINQMGTCHSWVNNKLVHQIWEWCITHHIWPTVVHIPGNKILRQIKNHDFLEEKRNGLYKSHSLMLPLKNCVLFLMWTYLPLG